MEIRLPEQVQEILHTLEAAGFEGYAVGGCVRDAMLGREPQDWDVTTNAAPQQVKALFRRTVDTGLQHGTVTVMMDHVGYELTTYRIDGSYEDGRHPSQVSFTSSLSEDLQRRDFTINAMAYNPDRGLVDLYGGQRDLEDGVIRCVGAPLARFGEDALRMMRAIRFSAQLGFTIEEHTWEGITALAAAIQKISAERIQMELVKTLVSKNPRYVALFYESGLSRYFLPELDAMMETGQNNPHHCYSVGEHTLHALDHVNSERILRLAVLFHDVAKPECRTADEAGIHHFHGHPARGADKTREILHRLKFDNDTIARVTALIRWHDDNPPLQQRAVRRAIHRVGLVQYPDLFALKRADILAQSSFRQQEKLDYVDGYETMYRKILEQGECLCIKDLKVDGRDLLAAGVPQGRQVGEGLKALLELVLEHPEYNERAYLLEQIQKGIIDKNPS